MQRYGVHALLPKPVPTGSQMSWAFCAVHGYHGTGTREETALVPRAVHGTLSKTVLASRMWMAERLVHPLPLTTQESLRLRKCAQPLWWQLCVLQFTVI